MFNLLIGYRYRSAAVVTDEPPVDPEVVQLVEELRGQPGTRAPHAWVRTTGACFDARPARSRVYRAYRGRAMARRSDFGVCRPWHPDPMHCIGDDGWAAITGLGQKRALLVRPDDFVGWRADQLPADPEAALRQALSAILSR